jgi:hypothetical protein
MPAICRDKVRLRKTAAGGKLQYYCTSTVATGTDHVAAQSRSNIHDTVRGLKIITRPSHCFVDHLYIISTSTQTTVVLMLMHL